MASQPPGPFTVAFSGRAQAEIKRLAALAVRLGRHRVFATNFRAVCAGLVNSPLTWGDPRYRFRDTPHLVVFHRAYKMLSIDCIVDENRYLVYVRNIRLLSRGWQFPP